MASPVVVRQARLSDLDRLTEIALAAMPMDPQWDWRFPLRREFPIDTYQYTRAKYLEFLENKSNTWRVMIAECQTDSQRDSTAIAFAVWDVRNIKNLNMRLTSHRQPDKLPLSSTLPSPLQVRRDCSPDRVQAWNEVTLDAKCRLFDGQFGRDYFQLQILATHPQYQRLGAGSALCNWGLKMARLENMTITVFASPMGRKLYSKLGFQTVSNVIVRVPNDDEIINLKAMIYQPVT